jgi:hypothetical protein
MAWSRAYKLGLITLLVGVVAAIATLLTVPEFRKFIGWDKPAAQLSTTSISGIVLDRDTNQGIGQAQITLAGRTEQGVTVDSGNFSIDLRSDAPKRLRLHVSKTGFAPLDTSVEAPADNLVLLLHK